MANTEGISDEDLSKLLSIDQDATNRGMPRGLRERERMMDEFDMEGEFQPSAKVIRSSKRPVIKSSKKVNKVGRKSAAPSDIAPLDDLGKSQGVRQPGKERNVGSMPSIAEKKIQTQTPVLAESVMERSVAPPREPEAKPKRVSKFKMRQQQKDAATEGGFPSFNIPVGTFTRKGKVEKKMSQAASQSSSIGSSSQPSDTDKLLANMSKTEINESVAEIESMLSAETIQFLRNRRKKTDYGAKIKNATSEVSEEASMMKSNVNNTKMKNKVISHQMSIEEKERTSKILSTIRTEEELDEAFAEAMGGISTTDQEPDGNDSELEAASRLLRSTAMRQRILGAKNVCELLEARLDRLSGARDYSFDESASDYPELLPVALRCILDSSSPQKHTQLLSYALRAISSMVILFAHPDHRTNLSISTTHRTANDIFQQDFMHDAVPTTMASASYNQGQKNGKEFTGRRMLFDGCFSRFCQIRCKGILLRPCMDSSVKNAFDSVPSKHIYFACSRQKAGKR